MGLAFKGIFLGQAWIPYHKTRNIYSVLAQWGNVLAQWGKQETVFTCPSAILYIFYLPRAMQGSS